MKGLVQKRSTPSPRIAINRSTAALKRGSSHCHRGPRRKAVVQTVPPWRPCSARALPLGTPGRPHQCMYWCAIKRHARSDGKAVEAGGGADPLGWHKRRSICIIPAGNDDAGSRAVPGRSESTSTSADLLPSFPCGRPSREVRRTDQTRRVCGPADRYTSAQVFAGSPFLSAGERLAATFPRDAILVLSNPARYSVVLSGKFIWLWGVIKCAYGDTGTLHGVLMVRQRHDLTLGDVVGMMRSIVERIFSTHDILVKVPSSLTSFYRLLQ